MKNNIKFDWDDILVVPKHTSPIRSRKEIIVNRLPLYVSPMDTVVDEENAKEFYDNGYEVCLPRHINYNRELNFCFFSYGLSEIKKILDESLILSERKVLIDIANGNMVELLDVIKKFKSIFPNKTLMVGNVANPITYKNLSEAGADIIRVGVGNGSGCHVSGTRVKTKSGYSNIEDLVVGDEVLTHLNTYEKITHVHILNSDDNLMMVNDNIATSDHEYYVVHKKYEEILTDSNIHEFAEWVELQNLSDDYYLLELI